jgi:ATP-binding cassette, subfamily C, bacterial CydD
MSRTINASFVNQDKLGDVSVLLIGMGIATGIRALAHWGSEAAASKLAIRIKSRLRMQLMEHLLAIGPAYGRGERGEQDVRTGELANSLTDGVEALDAYFSQYLPQIALAALIPLGVLIFVFPLDPLSGFILLCTAPLIPIFMILIGGTAEAMNKRQWLSLSRMSAYILDVLQGLTTLKLLGRSKAQIQTINEVSERLRGTTMDVLRVTFLSALTLELVTTISTAVVAVQVGLRLLYGYLDFEEAFFVLLLAPEFYLPLRMLGTRFHAGLSGTEAARRIFEILDIEREGKRYFEGDRERSYTDARDHQIRMDGDIHLKM